MKTRLGIWERSIPTTSSIGWKNGRYDYDLTDVICLILLFSMLMLKSRTISVWILISHLKGWDQRKIDVRGGGWAFSPSVRGGGGGRGKKRSALRHIFNQRSPLPFFRNRPWKHCGIGKIFEKLGKIGVPRSDLISLLRSAIQSNFKNRCALQDPPYSNSIKWYQSYKNCILWF